MSHVLVIGAGLAGCTAADELARAGVRVTLVEKAPTVGGKVRDYGCKATDRCQNCGVCLAGGLWEKTAKNPSIEIIPSSVVVDLSGRAGDFSATVKTPCGPRYINGISQVVVGTGFDGISTGASAHLQIEGTQGLMTGSELEAALLERNGSRALNPAPKSVAFLQCFGSRDEREDSMYCSRVCCGYSTRAAKVLKQYDPDCEITFFYMELQAVANSDYYKELLDMNIEFVKCRPVRITGGSPVVIRYDDPAAGPVERGFDLVVLSEGVHPGADSDWMADTYGLRQDKHGFLHSVDDGDKSGVYVAGCARAPLKIEEAYADAVAVARRVAASRPGNQEDIL